MLYVYAELSALPPSQSAAQHLMMSFSLQYCVSKDRTSFYSVPKKKYSNQENFGLRMIFTNQHNLKMEVSDLVK